METQIPTLIQKFNTSILRLALLGSLITVPQFLLAGGNSSHRRDARPQADQARLVQIVRNATKQFLDVNNAGSGGYGPFLGCVSGPDHGAMGVHYVNGGLVGDG